VLHAPPGLRPLPGTPSSGLRIGRCPRPALRANVGRVLRAPWGPGPDAARDLADQAVQAGEPGLSRAAVNSGALRELSLDRDIRIDNDFIRQLEILQGISHRFTVA
jgi:hypothetical protein